MLEPLTDDYLAAVQERVIAARPGKWDVAVDGYGIPTGFGPFSWVQGWDGNDADLAANVRFCNEARADVPALVGEIARLKALVAELEAAPSVAYRASHDSITVGHYRTPDAARAHCEAYLKQEEPYVQETSWVPDTTEGDNDMAPEALYMVVAGAESDTGYLVTPLEIASEFDAGAEE